MVGTCRQAKLAQAGAQRHSPLEQTCAAVNAARLQLGSTVRKEHTLKFSS